MKEQKEEIKTESNNRKTLPTPKKFKKKAMTGATSLLSIPKSKYIGKHRFSGLTLELTENHAILSRPMCISIYPTDNPTYMLLRYIYELSQTEDRTEEQETELINGESFMLSLTVSDFAGADVAHAIKMFLVHSKCLEIYAKQEMERQEGDNTEENGLYLDFLMGLYNQMEQELTGEEKVAEIEEK